MLANLQTPPILTDVSPAFSEYAAIPQTSGTIGVYIADASFLVANILGPDVSLPIDHAEFYAKPIDDPEPGTALSYQVSGRIALKDARSARPMMTMLRLAIPHVSFTQDGASLTVSDLRVSAEKLVEIAGNMYFKSN
jgi:hypothetical protein